MMQTDVATAVERHAFFRILDLPELTMPFRPTQTTPDSFGLAKQPPARHSQQKRARGARSPRQVNVIDAT